jgi:predicted kinase
MRELYLTVGAPAIGKTHWIKRMGLQDYTVSSDEIRHIVSNYQAVMCPRPLVKATVLWTPYLWVLTL